jgi:hypothetical protein
LLFHGAMSASMQIQQAWPGLLFYPAMSSQLLITQSCSRHLADCPVRQAAWTPTRAPFCGVHSPGLLSEMSPSDFAHGWSALVVPASFRVAYMNHDGRLDVTSHNVYFVL